MFAADSASAAGSPAPTFTPNLDADYQAAWGDEGGCSDQSLKATWGSHSGTWTGQDSATKAEALERAVARAKADQRVVEAMTAWSECMAAEGYDYDTPRQPIDTGYWRNPPTDADLAVAITDVECKHKVRLVETWREVLYPFEEEEIAKSRPIFDKDQSQIKEFVENSQRIIETHGLTTE